MESIKNKLILITGATSGIGEACAKLFAKEGAKLILAARSEAKLKKLAQSLIKKYNSDIIYRVVDVRDKKLVDEFYDSLPVKKQTIDILINNAGLSRGLEPIHDGNTVDWDEMIDTNIKGLLFVTRKFAPNMAARNKGHIVNIGSVAGHDVYPNGNVYCATKHAEKALSKAMRLDMYQNSIKVTSVDPGLVETNFSNIRFHGDKARAKEVYKGFKPLSAADIADSIFYAISRPAHVNINEIIITPTAQAAVGMIKKK
jgi:serine 3-dehydrogenase